MKQSPFPAPYRAVEVGHHCLPFKEANGRQKEKYIYILVSFIIHI